MSLNDLVLRQKEVGSSSFEPLGLFYSLETVHVKSKWKIIKENDVHRQSALFLKFVPTSHFSVILHLFVK